MTPPDAIGVLRRPSGRIALALLGVVAASGLCGPAAGQAQPQPQVAAQRDDALLTALAGPQRSAANVARDRWRHPYETLQFFGLQPRMTVIELSPSGGWYTEILAPYLREQGRLILAADDPESIHAYYRRSAERLKVKLESRPAVYGKVELLAFEPPAKVAMAAPSSADLVLTFRNVHNWAAEGDAVVAAVFKSAFESLKPGGVFGVVDHRLPADRPQDAKASSGYLHQAWVVRLAEAAGFRLAASSEINANAKDSADHVGGVWALPPSYRNKDADRARYEAIGESDRFTLKFVKP
jgi:predicted methyltransferase